MSSDRRAPHTPLLWQAGLALVLSLLLEGALAISVNPSEGETAYDVTSYLARLLLMVAVGLFAAWAAVRALTTTASSGAR